MSVLWEDIKNKFLYIKQEHNNQAKRAIKTQVPKQQIVRAEIAERKEWIQKAFHKLRDRTIQAFTKLDFNYFVPHLSTERIDITVTQIIDIDTDENNKIDEIPLNKHNAFVSNRIF